MFSLEFVPLELDAGGESLGFGLGRIDVDLGSGPPPVPSNHLVMVLPAAALLLDQAQRFLAAPRQKRMEFVGTGSSFALTFTREGRAIRVKAPAGTTTLQPRALAEELLRAAKALDATVAPHVPEDDAARGDLRRAIAALDPSKAA